MIAGIAAFLDASKHGIAERVLFAHEGQLSFFEYFEKYYADVIRHNTLKDLRISAGLGNPHLFSPLIAMRVLMHLSKEKLIRMATIQSGIVSELHEESIHALSGCGQYKLCKMYQHLQVDPGK